MKLANIKCFGMDYHGYYLIENLNDLFEYEDSIWKAKTIEAAKDIIHSSKRSFIGHCNTILGNTAHGLSKVTGQGGLYILTDLMGKTSANRFIAVSFGKKLAINHNGGYFPIPDNAVIKILPEYTYTEKDIHITQFEDGRHWYATVGGIDVVDTFFGRRFNTYDYAYKMALKFIKELNKHNGKA